MNTDKNISNEAIIQILSLSKDATAIYTTEYLYIQYVNDAMLSFWGKGRDIIGKRLQDAVVALDEQSFIALLKNVWHTGKTYEAVNTPATLGKEGQQQTLYYDFIYRALLDADGKTYAILHTATDVTDRMRAEQLAKEKEIIEHELNEELAAANEELQSLNEEYLTTNEELHSLNEEYLTTNEELQSLNEEYIVTNEQLNVLNQEVQTINEELTTTGEELKDAYDQLDTTYNNLVVTEEKARLLLERALAAVGFIDTRTFEIESANDKLLELWQLSREDIGRNFVEALSATEAKLLDKILQNVISSGKPVYGEDVETLRSEFSDAAPTFFNFAYQPVKDNKEQVTNVLIIANEVTDQYNAKVLVDNAYEQTRLAKQAAGLGMFDVDVVNNKLEWDERCRELFGLGTDKEVTYDDDFANGLHPDDKARILQAVKDAYNQKLTNGDYDVEYRTIGANDGKLRWIKAIGKVSFDENGKPLRFIGSVIDISDEKMRETRKDGFIAIVSHELKTPLTSAKAIVQMLKQKSTKENDAFLAGLMTKVDQQISKMQGLIKGFLDIARIESGDIRLNIQRFDLGQLITEEIDDLRVHTSTHNILFDKAAPTEISADRDKIGQVLSNLLANAIKYSNKGTNISITYSSDAKEVAVAIKDSGMGIDKEDLPKLFDRFYRVENQLMNNVSGFGIGLYICAEIIKKHNGRIWAESEKGVGSTFTFTLPLA